MYCPVCTNATNPFQKYAVYLKKSVLAEVIWKDGFSTFPLKPANLSLSQDVRVIEIIS